jgi:hypothetical protein
MIDMKPTKAIPPMAKQALVTTHRLAALTAVVTLGACGGGSDAPISAAAAEDMARFAERSVLDSQSTRAFALALPSAPTPEPIRWVKTAGENQTFGVNAPTEVRYGVGTTWIQRNLTGTVNCTNRFFGSDPALGIAKTCEILPASVTATWVKAAGENQTFDVNAPTEVRYGVGTTWIQRRLTGTVNCTNSFFGNDPALGVAKTCEILPTSASTIWVKAAGENQTFNVNTPTEVRYGVGTTWTQRSVNGSVNCTNRFFGEDPAVGVGKTCEISMIPVIGSAPLPAPAPSIWIKAAGENQPFNVNKTTEVRYGAGTKWIQRSLNGTVPCSNSFFGSDPAAGVVKTCEILTDSVVGSAPSPAPAPAPAPAPIPSPAPAPAPAPVPVNPFNCDTGAITCLEITSTGTAAQASLPVTFGQPFKAGDWRASSQGLVAKIDGVPVPVQTDETSSHRDGSTRFAVVSAQLGNIAAGQTKILNLYTGAKVPSTPAVPANPDWNLEVETQVFDASGNVTATLVAQPQAQLVAQIASNSGRRLSGAVASEYTVVTDFKDKFSGARHPHLSARFHTRLVDAGARIRTDVVMENTRTFVNAPGNITYSMVVKRNGATLHTQPRFTHFRQARWHKVVWSGSSAEPQARVRHNMPYFMASRAVWNYDLSVRIEEQSIASGFASLNKLRIAQAALGPMANLMLTPDMGTTGGRAEIGPLPQWIASYLISQDDRAREIMMAHADASGSVTVHYRDESTGLPLDLDTRPQVAVRVARAQSEPSFPTEVNGPTIWNPDTSHQGSLTYVPYLLTGDAFYLDEMMFWSSYTAASLNPGYRGGSAGLLNTEQVRGQAWGMRALGEVARSLPDNHAMKEYFQTRLSNNLKWFHEAYVSKPQSNRSPLGATFDDYLGDNTSPWQGDYIGIVFAQLAENNEPLAADVLDWISRFNIGRVTSDAQGFCSAEAAGYYWVIRSPNNGPFFTTWAQLMAANYGDKVGKDCATVAAEDGYPSWAGGYAATIRTMLAASANANVVGARTAYDKWKGMTPAMDKDYAKNPGLAIVPR